MADRNLKNVTCAAIPEGGGKIMSLLNQHRSSKQLWVVVILALILSLCVGMLVWLVWSEPADAPVSEEPSSSSRASSSKKTASSSSSRASSKSESSKASSSIRYSQGGNTSSVDTVHNNTNTAASKLQNMEINAALVHDENGTYNHIFINADGVTLKNKVVVGDLVISESVKNGTVTLENVVVKGRVLVNAAQTVNLNDVTAVHMIAQRGSGTTDYLVSGASTIHQFSARNQLTIDEGGLSANYAGIKKLSTERGVPMWQQVTLIKGSLEQVITNEATNLMLESGSSVDEVIAKAGTHIGGKGRVSKLIVRSDEVSYENEPRDIYIEGNYNQPNQQNWAIGQSELLQNGGSHSGGGSSTSALSTPQNLAVTAAGAPNSVTFNFNSVSNATGYTIIYSVINGSNALNVTNQTVTATTNSYTLVNSLIGQEGTVVSFKVRAISSSNMYTASDYSGEYSKTVVTLGTPTNVSLSLNGSRLVLSFTAAGNASAYGHEAVLSVAGREDVTITLAAGVTGGEFSNPVSGQTHTVTVRAVGDANLALSSSIATATCDVPSLSIATDISISNEGNKLKVTFTGMPSVSSYAVTLSYDGGLIASTGNSASGDVYTYLFNPPASITNSKQYTASVTPQGGLEATASKTVQQRTAPTNLSITSTAVDSVSFDFNEEVGMTYEVVSATKNATSLGVTADNLTATGITTVAGDKFNFSVKTLGDGMFYTDSQMVSATEVTVTKLAVPISPTISRNATSLTLSFSTTNTLNPHEVVAATSTNGGTDWVNGSAVPVNAGVYETIMATPAEGTLVRFSVAAKAANVLQADSDAVTSSELSVAKLAKPAGSFSIETVSGNTTFTFPSVANAASYLATYEGGSESTTTQLVTVTGEKLAFTVKAVGQQSGSVLYLDSDAQAVQKLAQATGLGVVYLDSGARARFQFDGVLGATSYTVSYTLSDSTIRSIGATDYATATSTPVTLGTGVTVTSFMVTAHKDDSATTIYLDSMASYTA